MISSWELSKRGATNPWPQNRRHGTHDLSSFHVVVEHVSYTTVAARVVSLPGPGLPGSVICNKCVFALDNVRIELAKFLLGVSTGACLLQAIPKQAEPTLVCQHQHSIFVDTNR